MEARVLEHQDGRKSVDQACETPCAIERGMRIIGGKWTGSNLPVRFNDLARMIGGASKKMIAERLRQMETRGLVRRQVVETKPLAVLYEITDFGRTALGFLDELRQWSESLPAENRETL